MNGGRRYLHRVRPSETSLSLLDLLATTYPHSPRSVWEDHLAHGRVLLNGAAASAASRLRAADELTYLRPPWREPAAPTRLPILHADAHLLALRKPSGLPVLPSELYYERTVLSLLAAAPPPHYAPVHRLGVATSGVLLAAASAAAKARLAAAFEARRVRKTYRALASGRIAADSLRVDAPIGSVPHASWGGSVAAAAPHGKPALSLVTVLARREAATLVEVEIPTGRPHQIRIHLAYAGHPLVGDPLYAAGGVPRGAEGGERPPLPRDGGYLLHALRVELEHPVSGERMTLYAAPPAELCVEGEAPFVEGEGEEVGGWRREGGEGGAEGGEGAGEGGEGGQGGWDEGEEAVALR
ncbi:hypothetical protein AB1Y20_016208 [Prymnesium parvum]|uniref:Pseudouridine synthase n=1 Tax=Prymnesium parvum TaxID=97485 RepID=A0AB34IDH4_PRYPA